jgi:hypothetical protein
MQGTPPREPMKCGRGCHAGWVGKAGSTLGGVFRTRNASDVVVVLTLAPSEVGIWRDAGTRG